MTDSIYLLSGFARKIIRPASAIREYFRITDFSWMRPTAFSVMHPNPDK